jgi:FRG domain-containing protein
MEIDAVTAQMANITSSLASWPEVADVASELTNRGWSFRGHERLEWTLQTSIEREFGAGAASIEREILRRFERTAPPFLPSYVDPERMGVEGWLGLIQHYGGPTRLLDITLSPYVALFFACESVGTHDRALWAINHEACSRQSAEMMARSGGYPVDEMEVLTTRQQRALVTALVRGDSSGHPYLTSLIPFPGLFALDPWMPDARQSAQQAMFLCTADASVSFAENLGPHIAADPNVVHRFALPGSLRTEVLDHLARMNVTAATLFPDLTGIARSLRTFMTHRPRSTDTVLPWRREREDTGAR